MTTNIISLADVRLTIDRLRCEAAALMDAADECSSGTGLIHWTAEQLRARHPGLSEQVALVASEQALWAGWPR